MRERLPLAPWTTCFVLLLACSSEAGRPLPPRDASSDSDADTPHDGGAPDGSRQAELPDAEADPQGEDGGAFDASPASNDGAAPDPEPDAGAENDAATSADDAGGEALPYEELFDPDTLPTFTITLSDEAITALNENPDEYQSGTLEYKGTVLENVGVRLKGRASFQGFDGKPGLKIKFNEFVSGQKLLGLKRLTLNNMTQDPSMARERIGFAFLRAAGLPAPRCNHARVYINGVYYGLYANLQTLDEEFVDEVFPGKTGNLFDITNDEYFIDLERESSPPAQETRFVLETNKSDNDIADLTALIDAVSTSADDAFVTSVEPLMNLDEVLMLGAVQAVMADWDGYFGARNNYKLYHEREHDKFVILPWGIDQSFPYPQVTYAIDHSRSDRPRSLIYDRCARDAGCMTRYEAKLRDALEVFEALPFDQEIDSMMALAKEAIAEDTRSPVPADEQPYHVDELKSFLHERAEIVKDQLSRFPEGPL